MKLTFLGTSHGHPEKGRYCTSVYIEHNGYGFTIDAGAPVEYLYTNRGIAPETIKAYFITHMHADHTEGLTALAKTYMVYHRESDVDVFFAEEEAIEPFRLWNKANHMTIHEDRFRMLAAKPGVIFDKYGIRVTAIRTEHISADIPSFAYIFESDDGKRVLFTGDLAYDFHDFPKEAIDTDRPFDVIVSELTHLSADKAKDVLAHAKTKLMIFSHVTPYNIATLEDNGITFPFAHVVACDGFEHAVR